MTLKCVALLIAVNLVFLSVVVAYNESYSYIQHDERDLLVRKARWLPLIYPRSQPARFKVGSILAL